MVHKNKFEKYHDKHGMHLERKRKFTHFYFNQPAAFTPPPSEPTSPTKKKKKK